MSTLLKFQHTLLEQGKAVYNISNQKLNPSMVYNELTSTTESFDKDTYSHKHLRNYINSHGEELVANGNIFKGEIKQNQIKLTILKEIN